LFATYLFLWYSCIVMKKIIGRDFKKCDYTIYDPEKRVSRVHLIVEKNEKGFIIFDESSSNGTYVNGNLIPKGKYLQVSSADKVTLSVDYLINLDEIFEDFESGKTTNNALNLELNKCFDEGEATTILGSTSKKVVEDDDATTILGSTSKKVVEDDDATTILGSTSKKVVEDDDATTILGSNSKKVVEEDDATTIMGSDSSCQKDPVTTQNNSIKNVVNEINNQKNKETNFVTIGRSDSNMIKLKNSSKISGSHCKIRLIDSKTIEIIDLGSTNGTFIDKEKLDQLKLYRFSSSVKVNLANELTLDLKKIFPNIIIDLNPNTLSQGNQVKLNVNGKKVVIDSDKTTIGEVLEFENIPFFTVGRKSDNKIVIDQPKISGYHCKIRLLNPMMFEIMDLGSTNGTFANKEKLIPNKNYIFASNTQISLGIEFPLNLTKILKGIIILDVPKPIQNPVNPNSLKPISKEEIEVFYGLEEIWEEYTARQHQIGSVANNWTLGGAAIGAIASVLTGGIGGAVIAAGSGLLGRYLGAQKSKEIKTDLNYENMFLVTYACPRCNESFQKRPWVTIRDCNKCKIKFRE